jgi:hypothetical protein
VDVVAFQFSSNPFEIEASRCLYAQVAQVILYEITRSCTRHDFASGDNAGLAGQTVMSPKMFGDSPAGIASGTWSFLSP